MRLHARTPVGDERAITAAHLRMRAEEAESPCRGRSTCVRLIAAGQRREVPGTQVIGPVIVGNVAEAARCPRRRSAFAHRGGTSPGG